MSDDNNILLKIKSSFEAQGTDAAERAQDRLASKTKDLNRTFQDNEKDTNRARQALGGLSAASAASQGSFSGLSRVLEGFSGRLADLAGKATLVAGAFSAGYGIGTAIDKWLGLSKAVADAYAPMEKVVSLTDRIKAQIGDLNATSLASVKKEFDSLTESLNSTMSQLDAVNRVKNQLMGQETEAQLAELEASMPPGPARDRAILQARRGREQTSIEERRNQARAKFSAAEQAKAGGESALWSAESAEGDARKQEMLFARPDSGATLEQRSAARQRTQAAEGGSAAARARMEELAEAFSRALMEKANTMRSLQLEERTSTARFSAGSSSLTAREREEATRLAARRQGIREGVSNDMLNISSDATRSAMQSELGGLSERADALRSQGMPAARVQDLRSKASGASKQADSAVAAVSAVLDSITARMKSLEDKLKNLPR
jgi:hypothetical protein